MIKIGILSFTKNKCEIIKDIIENHSFCKLIGISEFKKITMVDDDFKFINDYHDIIEYSDLIVLDSSGSEEIVEIKEIIRNSKHIYLINTKKFTLRDTAEMLKLSNEAGTTLLISQPYRLNPLINRVLDNSRFISFINITENGAHDEDCLLYNKLIEKVDMLMMLVKSNIYRISACSSSDEFINIRLEFNNAVNANITINQLADTNNSWIEILSPGENIKIDLFNNEVYKINKKRKSRIYSKTGDENNFENFNFLQKEFEMLINSIVIGDETEYSISNYHFANILTEEVLKKISYVLA